MSDAIGKSCPPAEAGRMLGGLLLVLLVAACGGGGGGAATGTPPFPPAISLTRVAGGLVQPVTITHAGDGSARLFVGEQGLLRLAFPPGFATRRTRYVNYTDRCGTWLTAQRATVSASVRRNRTAADSTAGWV